MDTQLNRTDRLLADMSIKPVWKHHRIRFYKVSQGFQRLPYSFCVAAKTVRQPQREDQAPGQTCRTIKLLSFHDI